MRLKLDEIQQPARVLKTARVRNTQAAIKYWEDSVILLHEDQPPEA
jgi:hypothetical protein